MEKSLENNEIEQPQNCYEALYEIQAKAVKEKCKWVEIEDKIKNAVEVQALLKIENKSLIEENEKLKAEVKISHSNKKSNEEKTNNFLSRADELEKDIGKACIAEGIAIQHSKDLQQTHHEMMDAFQKVAEEFYGVGDKN